MSAGGKPGLFAELVSKYTNYVYSLAYRLLGDRSDARDVAQEVFLKIYRNLGKLDDRKSVRNWVCTITINAARDYYRSHARHRAAVSFDETMYAGECGDHPDTRLLVDKMLGALEGNYRTAVVLFYLEQKSIKEIASLMARPEVLIKVWLHRARKMLLAKFGEER